ncbi:hypothetical protein CW684_10995, partial [Macrococcoides caseolyticum]
LQLQSNEKIKALEIELQEVKETTAEDNTTDIKAHSDNKGDNFYKDLRNDRESEHKGFLSKLFKR